MAKKQFHLVLKIIAILQNIRMKKEKKDTLRDIK